MQGDYKVGLSTIINRLRATPNLNPHMTADWWSKRTIAQIQSRGFNHQEKEDDNREDLA